LSKIKYKKKKMEISFAMGGGQQKAGLGHAANRKSHFQVTTAMRKSSTNSKANPLALKHRDNTDPKSNHIPTNSFCFPQSFFGRATNEERLVIPKLMLSLLCTNRDLSGYIMGISFQPTDSY
jgi:hypothetical protein